MGEWGYNPNLEKIMFALILLLMSKSGNNFAIFRHYSKCVSDMLDQTFFIVEKNPMLSYYYVLVQMPELKQRHYKNVKYHICLCSERRTYFLRYVSESGVSMILLNIQSLLAVLSKW